MNKKVMIIIILCVGIVAASTSYQKFKYPSGRDTYDIFGDGTFQIITLPNNVYALVDNGSENNVEENIYKYRKISPYVYVVGEKDYTILNYETGEIVQKNNLKDLPEKEQKIFKNEKKFKILKK